MVIYGTALLAFCLLLGVTIGRLLGKLLGLDTDVGGVGIAMLALIYLSDRLRKSGHLPPVTESGVLYWSAVYIPVTVAMAASQNVRAAVSGGPAALLAGALAVAACFALVPVLAKSGRRPGESGEPPSHS